MTSLHQDLIIQAAYAIPPEVLPWHAPARAAQFGRAPLWPEQRHNRMPGLTAPARHSRHLVGHDEPVVGPGGEHAVAAPVQPYPVADPNGVRPGVPARPPPVVAGARHRF